MLTALVTTPPVSAAITCSAVTTPARSCASAVEAPRCGVTTTSSRSKSGCSVNGSAGKTSSAAPAELARLEPGQHRVEVDQLAAGAVDQPRAVLHRRDRRGVDQLDRVRRLRHVQGDDVGPAEQLLELRRALDAELAEALGGDELVEGDDVHLEALGALGDELADPAEADHAERLAVELGALELRPLPGAAGQRGVRLRHVAAEGEHQRQRVLGGGDRVRFGRVGDDDAAPGRGGDVDVVDAGAGAADHLEALGALDQVGGQLRRRADQDRVVVADRLAQLLVGHLQAEVDVEVLAQQLDAGVGDLLLDQDLHRVTSARSRRPVDAGGERLDVGGLDRREHPDPQLVAAQLAVGLDVDDAVGAQRRRQRGGVDRVVEVDRADDERALRRVGDERASRSSAASAQP